ncbi:transposase [Salicibibacter kimchii]|uniref:Transposase n=2 Tax=Salicibibacter kimchii TaxID=2099786 RepID=A0A345BW36_9BACI|nr:transposase [Salicibibacter kimchii]
MALGALIIKEKLGTSDRETVEQISENPYLQYFLGLPEFTETAPFDASSMTHFRKRISREMIDQINAWLVEDQQSQTDGDGDDDDHHETPSSAPSKEIEEKKDAPRTHQGKLLIDATCAPADITYPTDLKLLKLEARIDVLHEPFRGKQKKPRTYRNQARKSYLSIIKQKSPKRKKVRKAIRKQLGYVKRDLNHLEELSRHTWLPCHPRALPVVHGRAPSPVSAPPCLYKWCADPYRRATSGVLLQLSSS